jgi:hypothetical protein
MLVARGVPAVEVFAAVAQEVGSVLGADAMLIARLDPDGAVTVVAGVGAHPNELAVGSDLHDGTQQRLVALSLTLRLAQSTVLADLPELQT